MPSLRGFFAPGTPASAAAAPGGSGGLPADVAELAAPLGRPSCAVGAVAVDLAAAAPAAGVGTEASSRSGTAVTGPDVELDVRWTAEASARIWGRGEVLAAGERARAFTPDDQVAGG